MDEPSAQLQVDLRESVTDALKSRRPVLHHLNADSSWLLQIPRPITAVKRGGRYYFNILIDPWLSGPQSDLASWFSQQWHATESKVGSIAAVEELVRQTEILASGIRLGYGRKSNVDELLANGDIHSFIDVVAISHEFTDHCHKETLHEINKDVPVIATAKAASLVKSWSHFRTVLETPPFGGKNLDWHATAVPPLPEWLGISRLVSRGDALYYHSALMISFNNGVSTDGQNGTNGHIGGTPYSDEPDAAEAVIYTPHGIHHETLKMVTEASPRIRTLAFLHGLHDVSIDWGQQLNLGAHNGLQAQRLLNAKYWVGTHDEVKKGGGLVAWFLRRKVISLGDALEKELKAEGNRKNGAITNGSNDAELQNVLESFEGTNWVEIGNGESRVLL